MHRILFICSGNMYRSAGAEFILRKKLTEAGIEGWTVDSAGTLQLGHARRPEAFGAILAEKGYDFGGETQYVREADPASADLILVMEPQHLYTLRSYVPQDQWDKIQLFMMYCFGSPAILADPCGFFCDDIYRDTRDTLERGCEVIVQKLKSGI